MITKQAVTAEQFCEMPEVPGKQFELVRGELVEVPMAGYPHARVVKALFLLLHTFVAERNLGEVFGDGLDYIIARMPDSVRGPDVSFIAAEHVPEEAFEIFVPFAPDLAVEVVSPGDHVGEVNEKVRQYLASGTRLVWVLCPKNRSVHVYTRGKATLLGPDSELDGGDVLPGFTVHVSRLFDDRAKR